MKTMTFAISDGTFLGSETIVSGSNSTGTHNVYVAFSQAESGTLAIQYKLVAETKWRRLGKVDLTGTEVAEFKLTGQVQDYRFVISNASGAGSIEVSDSEKLEDIHPLSFYGETGGMSPDEIGNKLSTGSKLGDGYDIILLAGQSNMIGRYGPIDAELDKADGRIFQYGNNGQVVSIAKNPLDQNGETPNTVGLGLNLAKYYADNYLDKGRKVLLVPVAVGGTSFGSGYWRAGGNGYENAIAKCNAAYAVDGNNRVVLIAWNQGESDSSMTEQEYSADLVTLVSGFRSNINSAASARFICAGVTPSSTSYSLGVYNASMGIQAKVERSAFVYADDLALGADSLHYSASSLRIMGRRYGAAIRFSDSLYSSDFDSDEIGSSPQGITDRIPDSGASLIVTDSGASFEGRYITFSNSTTSTFSIDDAPVAENNFAQFVMDAGAGRLGVTLKAHGVGAVNDGYLMQVNGNDDTVKIYSVSSEVYTPIGIDASVDVSLYKYWRFYCRGDSLLIDYSSDGDEWFNARNETDTTFAGVAGGVSFSAGYGSSSLGIYIKSIKCGALVTD